MKDNILYFLPFVSNLMRYFLIAGIPFLIFYIWFPKKFIKDKVQTRVARDKDFWREISHSLVTMFVLSCNVVVLLLTPIRGFTQIYEDPMTYGFWWLPFSILVAMILHDTYFYWMHRIIHHPTLFRKLHLVHHKSTNPTPWAALSFNLGEAILESLVIPFIVLLVPMHPIAMFAFSIISFAFNVYGHLGFEIMPRWFRHSFLFEILNTSVHHNLHHEKFKGNYGLYFRVWDRLVGTEHPEYVARYDRIQARRFGAETRSVWRKAKWPILILILGGSLSAKAQTTITGTWKDDTGGGTIEIYEEGGLYYGKIVAAQKATEQKKIQGKNIIVLRDFEKKSDQEYCCGTLFQPRFKREVQGTLTLIDPNTLQLTGTFKGFSRNRVWTRLRIE